MIDECDEMLTHLAEEEPDIYVVDGGHIYEESFALFADRFPERYINVGYSEQNLALVAAGLAGEGKLTVVGPSTPFFLTRAYDQIRGSIALPAHPMIVLGVTPGFSNGAVGGTIQVVEDIALVRALPGVSVLVPSDRSELSGLLERLVAEPCCSYVRLSAFRDLPDAVGAGNASLAVGPGGARSLRTGDNVTLCACGIMVSVALEAAETLSRQGIEADVLDCYSVKPLPRQDIIGSVRRTGCCVVAEEHSVVGGLGSAVSELVCSEYPVPVRSVAIGDTFGQSGAVEELREYYALTAQEIVGAVGQVWAMRRRT